MIIPSYAPAVGGAEKQVRRIAQSLVENQWPVEILTRRHGVIANQTLAPHETIDGIPVTRFYSRGSTKIGLLCFTLASLWHLLLNGRGDIYHAHDVAFPGWLAVCARYLFGGRCLVKMRTGRYLYEKRIRSYLARTLFVLQLNLVDRIIVVNHEVAEMLIEIGINKQKIDYIPNAIDTTAISPINAEQKSQARASINLPNSFVTVLYVGRLAQLKGVDVLINAWSQIDRQNARLLIVGDGPELSRLQSQAERIGCLSSIQFCGMQSNVLPYFQAADLFVLPSRTEGLSNAMVEAMSAGLPVIASNVGGAPDLLQHGQNGYLFASEDDATLAHLISNLIESKDSRNQLGIQARETVCARADFKVTFAQFIQHYHSLSLTI